ncbi:MAG TPA: adenylate/guanylate cyclase domain-containing protein, partial [Desulfosarcina sp.]|nr:adenylate/guanylate cyclase domain-containing protein [Desulfosarcina sp.]
AMQQLNRHLAEHNLPPLEMGIGINSGPVVVGNIGSEQRRKYGIVGSAVNTTQRVQCQSGAGEVVATGAVVDMVRSRVEVRREFSTSLKGLASDAKLYAIAPKADAPAST